MVLSTKAFTWLLQRLSIHPTSLLLVLLMSVSVTLQGSTESNATNDEEEMKGRKGTQEISSFYHFLLALFLCLTQLCVFDGSDCQA